MRKFLNVFKFELSQIFKQKSFYITMFVTAAIVFGLTFIPRINSDNRFTPGGIAEDLPDNNEENIEELPDEEKESIALFVNGKVNQATINELKLAYNVKEVNSEEQLSELVEKSEVDMGVILTGDLEAKVLVKDQGIFNNPTNYLSHILENNYKYNIALEEEGISREAYERLESVTPVVETENLGKNPIVGYTISYLALMFLYFTILMHGNGVATDVAKEKDSRTMEILITNIKPKFLIWGKVFARAVSTLIQLVVLIIAVYAGIKINGTVSAEVTQMVSDLFGTVKSIDIVLLTVFALTGVIMYYFLFASFGSLVNKVDELPQVLSPITMLIVAAFMLPMFSISSPTSQLMKIVSFIPFTSPLAIFPRYLMTSMPITEVLISYIILLITTFIMAWLSNRIYRYGTLNYGNKLNVWKLLTKKQ